MVSAVHSRRRSAVFGDARFWFCQNLINFTQHNLCSGMRLHSNPQLLRHCSC